MQQQTLVGGVVSVTLFSLISIPLTTLPLTDTVSFFLLPMKTPSWQSIHLSLSFLLTTTTNKVFQRFFQLATTNYIEWGKKKLTFSSFIFLFR